jgi:hypothetical protein
MFDIPRRQMYTLNQYNIFAAGNIVKYLVGRMRESERAIHDGEQLGARNAVVRFEAAVLI